VHGGVSPDCTLLLDVPVSVGLARARNRGAASPDRFEAETGAFFERVRAGYLELARQEPGRVRLIDAAVPLEVVQSHVGRVLEGLV
jgi:dTMP kinase